jgi:hypothetical protein
MPPRPRPLPRPANRQASDRTQQIASSSTTHAVPVAKSDRELELDKGDELFLRNRYMTTKDWKKLDKQTKGESGHSFDAYMERLTRILQDRLPSLPTGTRIPRSSQRPPLARPKSDEKKGIGMTVISQNGPGRQISRKSPHVGPYILADLRIRVESHRYRK